MKPSLTKKYVLRGFLSILSSSHANNPNELGEAIVLPPQTRIIVNHYSEHDIDCEVYSGRCDGLTFQISHDTFQQVI